MERGRYVVIFGLMAELMLDCIHKGEKKIDSNKLLKDCLFLHPFRLAAIHPDVVGNISGIEYHLAPELATFGVTFIGRG